jgi:hypothetical protein
MTKHKLNIIGWNYKKCQMQIFNHQAFNDRATYEQP